MKWHNILTKLVLFLLIFIAASSSLADIQVGYFVIRVEFTGEDWQPITEPKLILCPREFGDQALTANHSILIGFDDGNTQITEFRFPNPRVQIGDWGPVLATDVVADIFIPADAGMAYLIFKEQHDSAIDSLMIDVSTTDATPVNCDAPEFPLHPTPTEVEGGIVEP